MYLAVQFMSFNRHQSETLPIKPQYHAIVIGTGLGGASAALRLGQLGLKVLLVERGNFLRAELAPGASPGTKYIYDIVSDRSAPLSYVGGMSKFYGAAMYRFRESDFNEVEHEVGVSPGWPISYLDLETYYGEAEQIYKVHGA